MAKNDLTAYDGLTIANAEQGTNIVDENGEVVFQTSNREDAQKYLELLRERDQYQQLLESRGIAPHRIYLLAADKDKRGRVNAESLPAKEVVIIAKTDLGALVVRDLETGKEEIVDPEELEPIEGGSYLRASDVQDEVMHALIRYRQLNEEDREVHLRLFRSEDSAEEYAGYWEAEEEAPGSEYEASQDSSEEGIFVYRADVIVED